MWRCTENPNYTPPTSEKKPKKKVPKKTTSLNVEQCIEKLEQQISINTEEQCSDTNSY